MKTKSVFLSSLVVQIKQTFSRSMFRFCALCSPFLNTVFLGEMYKLSSAKSFTSYVILGAGLMSLWECICFSSASDINRERYSNTLSLIFVSPSDFRIILFGKVFGNTILSLVSFALTLFFSAILYGQSLDVDNFFVFLLAFLFVLLSFFVFSIFVSYVLTLSRKTEVLMNCLDIPLTLICGFVFQIEYLPRVVQNIAMIFPMTWSVKLLRQSVEGGLSSGRCMGDFAIMIGTIIFFVLLSELLYKVIVNQVRIKATLDLA